MQRLMNALYSIPEWDPDFIPTWIFFLDAVERRSEELGLGKEVRFVRLRRELAWHEIGRSIAARRGRGLSFTEELRQALIRHGIDAESLEACIAGFSQVVARG